MMPALPLPLPDILSHPAMVKPSGTSKLLRAAPSYSTLPLVKASPSFPATADAGPVLTDSVCPLPLLSKRSPLASSSFQCAINPSSRLIVLRHQIEQPFLVLGAGHGEPVALLASRLVAEFLRVREGDNGCREARFAARSVAA